MGGGGLSTGGLIQLRTPPPRLHAPAPGSKASRACLQVRSAHDDGQRPPLGELFMLYNTPVLKRAAALAATKKTSASKHPACVASLLSPGMLLTPAERSSSILSQLFTDGVEKRPPSP